MGRRAGSAALGDHYEALYRSGRKKRPTPPELPEEMVHLWNVFTRLARARQSNGFGLNPISWTEIDSYNRLTRANLQAWEVETIMALDDAFLGEASEKKKDEG